MMYKKTLTALVITGSFIANPIFASNIFQKLTPVQSMKKNTPFATKAIKSTNGLNSFVDFSGTWEGKCEDDDEISTMLVESSEYGITIDGQSFAFGSLETISTSNSDYTFFTHMLIDWNNDKSKLNIDMSFTSYSQKYSDKTFGAGKGTFSIAGDKLILEINGMTSTGEKNLTLCTYNKK